MENAKKKEKSVAIPTNLKPVLTDYEGLES